MTTQAQISQWFDDGVKQGATHLIVACDTWDYEDYPVYVTEGEDAKAKAEKYNSTNMQSLMEVYKLTDDKVEQLNIPRCIRF